MAPTRRLLLVLAACVVMGTAATTLVAAQTDGSDSVPSDAPERPEMTIRDNNLLFRVPKDKDVIFERYRREEVNYGTIASALNDATSVVDNTDLAVSAAQAVVAAAAAMSDMANLEIQVDGLLEQLDGAATTLDLDVIDAVIQNAQAALQAADTASNAIADARAEIEQATAWAEGNHTEAFLAVMDTMMAFAEIQDRLMEKTSSFDSAMSDLEASIDAKLETLIENLDEQKDAFDDIVQTYTDSGAGALLSSGVLGGDPAASAKKAVYRWNTFHTYGHDGWYTNNNANFFGGINPSSWTDGSAFASSMSSDKNILRTLINKPGYAGKNGLIYEQNWRRYSSTSGRMVIVWFRIRNTRSTSIRWTPFFAYSSYTSWSERASVAMNGSNRWSAGNCAQCTASVNLDLPGNKISNIFFVATSGHDWASMRTCVLFFYNDSLDLPDGLEYVDDFDTLTGTGW